MAFDITKPVMWPGTSTPLGATWDGEGVNFALFSAHAEKVELCLFDDSGRRETARVPLLEYTDEIWYGYLPGAGPGLKYGYRVYGPYDPKNGHRFNHHKVVIDPYARELSQRMILEPSFFGYRRNSPQGDLSFDRRDNAANMPKCVVVDSAAPKKPANGLKLLWQESIIYEAHVRGLTMRHPELPEVMRGTVAGLGHPATIRHLTDLGVNMLELLPLTPVVHELHLTRHDLSNYWGYNPLNFFTVEPRYLATDDPEEFRDTMARLHDAGIQVIVDVVYNHTGEGNHRGPTLSFRGIDNASYYRLESDRSRYADYTGCGNTLNLDHPRVLQLVMDSLRYWIEVMHVDGFRFDLATTLGRNKGGYDPSGTFLSAVRQDPVLSRVKLIAEPWDLGPGGYQVGNFPPGWSEWNDGYRDTVRSFWKGAGGLIGELAYSLTGSSQRFEHRGRQPRSSVNFVTAHDGFTLEDLVSYQRKNNIANHENNRDGTDNNLSWNCGVEGPTDNEAVRKLRFQQKRNFIATLLLSQGVPMLVAGDELGRTQGGNNNAYCQDNEISWLDWSLTRTEDKEFLEFVKTMTQIRRTHPVFRRPRFFHGNYIDGSAVKDITWLSPDGRELNDDEWRLSYGRCFGFHLGGDTGEYYDRTGRRLTDDRFVVLLNAHDEIVPFMMPEPALGTQWMVLVDTARPSANGAPPRLVAPKEDFDLQAHSLVVMVHQGSPHWSTGT